MKLNLAISICIVALGACGAATASGSSANNMSSVYKAATHPAPPQSTPSTRSTTVIGEDRFRPYKGTSTYSNRGGVNSYPAASKPKGYRPY